MHIKSNLYINIKKEIEIYAPIPQDMLNILKSIK